MVLVGRKVLEGLLVVPGSVVGLLGIFENLPRSFKGLILAFCGKNVSPVTS